MNQAIKSYNAKCKKFNKAKLCLFDQVEEEVSDHKFQLSNPRHLRIEPKDPPKPQEEKRRKGKVGSCPKSPQPQPPPQTASPQPPIRDLFDEFHKKKEEKEQAKIQIKRCPNLGTCDCIRSWVTIFGYPKRFERLVICFFGGIAHIVEKYVHHTGNWMYLRFKSNLDCKNVMQYNHCAILPQKLYVGIIMGAPEYIMTKSDRKPKQNVHPESPQPQRVNPDDHQAQSVNPDSLQPEHVCPESPQSQRVGPKSPQPQHKQRLFNTDLNPIVKTTLWQRALELLDL